MRSSTRALVSKHGWRVDRAVHNYVYFAFYAPYVRVLTFMVDRIAPRLIRFKPSRFIFRMMANRVHSKILSGDNVSKVLELKEDVSALTDKNRAIAPWPYAYKILLENPEYIAVMDCPCKKAVNVKEPEILNSCFCVGKETTEFWLDRCREKYNARRVTQEEALDMIRGFRKRGYITQIFFKVATGGNTGLICNCRMDDCASLRAHRLVKQSGAPGIRLIAESGYAARHDASRCVACGACVRICMFGAVESRDGKRTGYRREDCMGCGLCVEHCPQGALELYRDMGGLVPLDLDIVREEYLP